MTAQQVGSYKPAPGHFERFREVAQPAEDGWVHVACSWFHDMQAARDLGLKRIWVDRDRTGQDPAIANAVLRTFDDLLETLERVRHEPVPSLATGGRRRATPTDRDSPPRPRCGRLRRGGTAPPSSGTSSR